MLCYAVPQSVLGTYISFSFSGKHHILINLRSISCVEFNGLMTKGLGNRNKERGGKKMWSYWIHVEGRKTGRVERVRDRVGHP